MNPSSACSDLNCFADDELPPERAEEFLAHLDTCEACRDGLERLWQLDARLTMLAEQGAGAQLDTAGIEPDPPLDSGVESVAPPAPVQELPGPSPVAEVAPRGDPRARLVSVPLTPPSAEQGAGAQLDTAGVEPDPPPGSGAKAVAPPVPAQELSGPSPVAEVAPRGDPRAVLVSIRPTAPSGARSLEGPPGPGARPRLRLLLGGGAVALAALVVFMLWPARPPTAVFAELTTRPNELRLAYPGASAYRPPRDEVRGDHSAPVPDDDHVLQAAIDTLRRRGDGYGLAIARAWHRDDPDAVIGMLKALPPSPSVESDRVALEALRTTRSNLDPQLAEIESLRTSSDPAAARAARWNYAILLSRLELPLGAGQAFQALADEREPGWADEAATRADQARSMRDSWASWHKANDAGSALALGGAPVPIDLVRRFPGVMRAHFYNAVRAAHDPAQVRALRAMAEELDRVDGAPVLTGYVDRIAGLDFRRRAPLASAYKELLADRPSAAITAAIAAPEIPADIADIVMGAMIQLDAVPDHLEAFRRLAAQSGDPWFAIVLARGEAAADIQQRKWKDAELHLRTAQRGCTAAIRYQCLALDLELGRLYQNMHRIPDAAAVLRDALAAARAAGEWAQYRGLLQRLADAERYNSSLAMARAYANEVLLLAQLPGDPWNADFARAAHLILTGIAIRELDGPGARHALELVRPDEPPALTVGNTLTAANYLSDIGRLDPRDGDLPRLQGWLGKLRASGALTVANRIVADEIEGRLLILRDRVAGRALLERAIEQAEAEPLSRDADAQRPRTGAFSVLVFDAAQHGEHARVLALSAQELRRRDPGPCTVTMIAEDERAAVAVRGSDGQVRGTYYPRRRAGEGALIVPSDLASALDGCRHVGVLAQATLQGQPGILPDGLPWSYLTGARPARGPLPDYHGEPRTLIVANVNPPEGLGLPPLSRRVIPSAPSVVALSGAEANPQRVLTELRSATEVEFDTHALRDAGISDASHLVLSPADGGTYALTAEAIGTIELRGRPIVVLAACASARGANYQYAARSLPDAFIGAGARAVLAAATEIPDQEAGPFFTGVLVRIRTGTDPAVALRDARRSALQGGGSRWAAGVVLFE